MRMGFELALPNQVACTPKSRSNQHVGDKANNEVLAASLLPVSTPITALRMLYLSPLEDR